jgi:hypothetical protein
MIIYVVSDYITLIPTFLLEQNHGVIVINTEFYYLYLKFGARGGASG